MIRSMKAVLMAGIAVPVLSLGSLATVNAAAHHTSMDSLVIKITKSSGILWGHVSVDYLKNGKTEMLPTCKAAKCTLHPPHMVKLTLRETPTHPTTWPFHAWKLTNGHMKATTSMGKTLKFEIDNGMATVWAKYILKQ